jgi:glycine/D-amino acid oxidase-like deaminating enzyme
MKWSSYWLDTAPSTPDYAGTTLPSSVDVAIVGGGLTGLSAAIHLSRKGASVALLETERFGWGASGRNGGMCTTGATIGFLALIRRYGVETAKKLFSAYGDAIDLVERLVTEEAIDCAFARSGKLELAAKPSHVGEMKATQDALARHLGYETTFLTATQIGSEIGTTSYSAGLVDRNGAGLHVGRFTRGLVSVADRLGVGLHEKTMVLGLQKITGSQHDVRTNRGMTRASQVLLATDGYTGGAVPRFQRRIVPVGSFIVVTEPLDARVVDELMPTRRMASDTKNLLYYFRITPDNRMLFGGRAQYAMSNPKADRRSARILQKGMVDVFPALADASLDYAWGGQVGLTLDRIPHAGVHDGVFFSMGYCGHGVQMATYMGRQMAEVMDGRPEANPWGAFPFRAVPLHFGPPWFLPFADVYYHVKDKVS